MGFLSKGISLSFMYGIIEKDKITFFNNRKFIFEFNDNLKTDLKSAKKI